MFAYCGNNPVNHVDSSGTMFEQILEHFSTLIKNLIARIVEVVRSMALNVPYCDDVELTMEQMKHNAELVYAYLSEAGWSHNAICAVLGNMSQESTINPGRHEKGGSGFGLVQWTPATKYTKWADENGYAYSDMYGQLEYLIYSMHPGCGEWFKDQDNPDYYISASYFITSNYSIPYLTLVFQYSYERAGTPMNERRIYFADYWDKYFGG